MALDDWQRRLRRRYLGSSDAAAVVGRDPWHTPYDVWAEKVGRVPARNGRGAELSVGQFMEESCVRWLEGELGTMISRDQMLVHANGLLCANLDGLALATTPPAIVEAKTAGIVGTPRYMDEWGEPGTDEVPTHTLIQTQHQLAVARSQPDLPRIEWCLVPALIVFRGFVLYRVRAHEGLMDAIVEQEERFFRDYIETDTPPPDTAPSLDVLRRMGREPNKTALVDPQLVKDWLLAREVKKIATDREEQAKEALLGALGDAEAGLCPLGTVSYLEHSRAGYTVNPTTYRRAHFKPAPGKGRRGGR